MNQDEEAIIFFDKALQQIPNSALVLFNKGISLVETIKYVIILKLNRFKEALLCFNQCLQMYDHPTVRYNQELAQKYSDLYDDGKQVQLKFD